MTKQDFFDWKRHPVTQLMFIELSNRIAMYTEKLVASAGKESNEDARLSGAILAIQDVLDIELEPQEGE